MAIYRDKSFHPSTVGTPSGAQVGIILDKTNFYAEQGGQEYDTGKILIDDEAELVVQNVQVYGGYVLHTGYMKYGNFSVEDDVICEYDEVSFRSDRRELLVGNCGFSFVDGLSATITLELMCLITLLEKSLETGLSKRGPSLQQRSSASTFPTSPG